MSNFDILVAAKRDLSNFFLMFERRDDNNTKIKVIQTTKQI